MHINKSFVMEFLGTFFLVLTVAMGLHPLAIASMLMAWLYIGGYVSGAHYNPMVSLAVKLTSRTSWHTFGTYALAQIVGGCAAYAFSGYLQGDIAIPAPAAGITLPQAFFVEVLLSFVLAYVILTVTSSAHFKNSNLFGFAIGFTIPALAAVGAQTSGGLFNPAISLGAAICGMIVYGTPFMFAHLLMYVGGAFLGGVIAARAFEYFDTK